jgi:hypothetical protein
MDEHDRRVELAREVHSRLDGDGARRPSTAAMIGATSTSRAGMSP